MLTLRLGGRLLVGSGRDGAIRWLLTALGVAIVVFALVLTWKIPQVVSAGVSRAEDRAPVSAKEVDAEFHVSVLQDTLGGRVRTRVLLSNVDAAATPPHGIPRMPEPGEVFRSPAWSEAEGAAAGQVGEVGPAGLTDPDEYVEYVGVAANGQAIGRPASGFGVTQPGSWVSVTTEKLLLIQLLLLAVPLGGYLMVASRLSAESRRRRMASFSLLGMDDDQIVKVSSLETVVHATTGALLGFAAFALLAPVLGQQGWLGMRWFADDVALGVTQVVVVALLVIIAAVRMSVSGSRRLLAAPLSNRVESGSARLTWWRWLPLVVGVVLLGSFVVVAALPGRSAPGGGTVTLLVGAALAVAGLALTSRMLLRRVAAAVPATKGPLSIRLAARRIELLPGVTTRVLATLLLMVLAGAIGTAVLEVARSATGPQGDTLTLFITSDAVDPQQVAATAAAASPLAQASVATSRSTAGSALTDRIVAECADAAVVIGRDLPGCEAGGSYRLLGTAEEVAQWGLGLAGPGDQIDFGGGEALRMPDQLIRVEDWGSTALSPSTVLVAQPPATAAAPPGTRSLVMIDNTPERAAEFLDTLRERVPDAAVDALAVNTEGFETYRIYRGIVTLGLAMGLLLGLGGYALTAIDARRVSRRNTAALLATGIPTRTIRASQVWRDLLPLIGGLMLWGCTSVLIAFAYLELGDAPGGSRLTVLAVVAGAALVSCVVVAAGGSVLSERRVLTPGNLRRE